MANNNSILFDIAHIILDISNNRRATRNTLRLVDLMSEYEAQNIGFVEKI
ncbi:5670_t:CDS:2 [Entrophospora sp. SA101]|nr:5670_t:CDS:2 [Entrophospora sp. SA101]